MRIDSSSEGDPARHRKLDDLDARLGALPRAPLDRGTIALVVSRGEGGLRHEHASAMLTTGGGVPGDRWAEKLPAPNPEQQLAVMQRDIAELVANGQSVTLAGDNLFVNLDLSAANLPIGTRLRAGGAVLEVTPHAHNGCKKFRARFGHDALTLVSRAATRPLNLRGIYMKVVEEGPVAPGDSIEVISRPTA